MSKKKKWEGGKAEFWVIHHLSFPEWVAFYDCIKRVIIVQNTADQTSKKQYSSFGTNIWGESGSSYVVLFLSIGSQKREPCFKTLNNFCPFDENLVFQ